MSIECMCEAEFHRQEERHLVQVFVGMKVRNIKLGSFVLFV
jgi:hypothetical protein